jgi:hypothetical protein
LTDDGQAGIGERYLTELGRVTAHFNDLTSQLRRIAGTLLTPEEPIGELATIELSFRQLVMLTTSLFLYRAQEQPDLMLIRDQVDTLMKSCLKAEESRNQLMHSDWWVVQGDDDWPSGVYRHKSTAKMKGLTTVLHEQGETEIRAVADELKRVRDALILLTFREPGLRRFFERQITKVTAEEIREAHARRDASSGREAVSKS